MSICTLQAEDQFFSVFRIFSGTFQNLSNIYCICFILFLWIPRGKYTSTYISKHICLLNQIFFQGIFTDKVSFFSDCTRSSHLFNQTITSKLHKAPQRKYFHIKWSCSGENQLKIRTWHEVWCWIFAEHNEEKSSFQNQVLGLGRDGWKHKFFSLKLTIWWGNANIQLLLAAFHYTRMVLHRIIRLHQ